MPKRSKKNGPRSGTRSETHDALKLRKLESGAGYVLVHPRCVRDRAEDIEEVRLMIDAGELEVATDEIRWLLSGCSAFVEAHLLAGVIAVELSNDVKLARGHFGYAYGLGLKALHAAKFAGPLLAAQPANGPWHEAGRGLAWCLQRLDKAAMADEVVATLLAADASDPMGVAELIRSMRAPSDPLFQIDLPPSPGTGPK
ncbi:hypothetical protein Pla175_33920 [Pirellulimonas nuda]|uniref:Uncharacterized protein n=1 Tax=Pirellulimonas nuda TaxID=2528009 RepID=A0A518DEV7_9BACT|nr:hypothetical protein [Pirellulimonas nuda]QDU89993.1 hypothetical protein Pla175_33920 [Pirellulimonas nuda]